MGEMWSYDKIKRFGKNGKRWHFVTRHFLGGIGEFDDLPYELYFRDDERTEFGLLRFEKSKDNPYRDYDAVISKIMNNTPFRKSLLNPETADVWKKNWK
jgi:hypothetical protein